MYRSHEVGAVLPLKALERSKSRLAWPREERERLMRGLLARALDVLARSGVRSRYVVSRDASLDAELLEEDVPRLAFANDTTLSVAVTEASMALTRMQAPAMLMMSADLPRVAPEDVEAMLRASGPGIAVIARAHDGGTNALLVPLPTAMRFAFTGDGKSAQAHVELAKRAGLRAVVLDRPGLAWDLDTPADLAHFGLATPGALAAA